MKLPFGPGLRPANRRRESLEQAYTPPLRGSVARMLRKIAVRQEQCVRIYKENNTEERLQHCATGQSQVEAANYYRERDDAIYRAYYGNGGICSYLERYVEFCEERREDMLDAETIFLLAFRGMLETAAFQLRRLTSILEGLDKNHPCQKTVAEIKDHLRWQEDVVLQQHEEKLREIDKALENEDANPAALSKQVRAIATDLDVLLLEAVPAPVAENLKQLKAFETVLQALPQDCQEPHVALYATLCEYLAPKRLEPLADYEGIESAGSGSYMERLCGLAKEIQGNVLASWQR